MQQHTLHTLLLSYVPGGHWTRGRRRVRRRAFEGRRAVWGRRFGVRCTRRTCVHLPVSWFTYSPVLHCTMHWASLHAQAQAQAQAQGEVRYGMR